MTSRIPGLPRQIALGLVGLALAATLFLSLIWPTGPANALERPTVLVQVAGPSTEIRFSVDGTVAVAAIAQEAAPRRDRHGAPVLIDGTDSCTARAGDSGILLAHGSTEQLFDAGEINLRPTADGPIRLGSLSLPGTLVLRRTPDAKLLAFDRLDIETYVAGVLLAEMPGWFEEEALRAQAIAVRSYAWHQTRVWHKPLWADQRSQVFRGDETLEAARPYVEATAGEVLEWNGQPLRAYYHSTCGGRTESSAVVFGETPLPPLSGGPCTSCQDSPRFRWQVSIPMALLASRLLGEPQAEIRNLSIERDAAEQTKVLVLTTRTHETRVTFDDLAAVCREASLAPFYSNRILSITTKADAFIVLGAGWGHRVGLCQYGANGLARRGLDHLEILGWYYPGASLLRAWD